MDPPLINEGSFSTANPSMAEIWPYNNNGGDSGMSGLRMGSGGFTNGLIDHLLSSNGGNNHVSVEESSVTEHSECFGGGFNGRKSRENGLDGENSKVVSATSSGSELKNSNGKRTKTSEPGKENCGSKASGDSAKPEEKPVEPLKDYIHVRARRGQATDSHSLAERARREKIGERMKMLQDLVPGTNKVIGKALVLDEIINYVQSLQRQVEFLSMKLEAVNSGMIPAINGFHSKDVNQLGMAADDPNGMMYNAQSARELAASGGQQSEWLHMQLGGNFERTN